MTGAITVVTVAITVVTGAIKDMIGAITIFAGAITFVVLNNNYYVIANVPLKCSVSMPKGTSRKSANFSHKKRNF